MGLLTLRTTSRTFSIELQDGETILEALRRSNIPSSSVIVLDSNGGFCSLSMKCRQRDRLTAHSLRNVDFDVISPSYEHYPVDNPVAEVFAVTASPGRLALKQLSRDAALDRISADFTHVLDYYMSEVQADGDPPVEVLIALSAGGDSRVLAECARRYSITKPGISFHAITCSIGFEDDGSHVAAAKRIAAEFGLTHTALTPAATAASLGLGPDVREIAARFLGRFSGDEPEVLGTYFVQEVMAQEAAERGCHAVIMGYNLEDAVADRLYQLMCGRLLPPFPIRRVETLDILAPLYLTPKRVLDALDLSNSLRNYELRRPSESYLRSALYFAAYSLAENFPPVAHVIAGSPLTGDDPDAIKNWLDTLCTQTSDQ